MPEKAGLKVCDDITTQGVATRPDVRPGLQWWIQWDVLGRFVFAWRWALNTFLLMLLHVKQMEKWRGCAILLFI